MIIKFGDVSETGQLVVHLFLLLIGIICFTVCFLPAYWRERGDADRVSRISMRRIRSPVAYSEGR
jgi:hypothetical protein